MVFYSKLPKPSPPSSDLFHFIFHEGREEYPRDRVLYREHETNETLTLQELEDQSRKLASVLVSKYSIKPNDVVAFLAHNSISYPDAFFGVLAAGATISPVPMQKDLDAQAVGPRLKQAKTKLIITDAELAQVSREAAEMSGGIPLISLDKSQFDDIAEIQELLVEGDATFDDFSLSTPGELEAYNAFIYRTSGSPEEDTWISSLPFAYGINAKLNLGLNILLAIPVIILKKQFDHTSLPLIDQYGITFLFMTPPLAAQIAKSEKGATSYKSIKLLLPAGAPVHPKIRDAVQEIFNSVRLSLEWGTTETLLIALQIDEESSVPGSSGTLVNGVEARVIDVDSGKELGPNQQGEILVHSSLCRYAGYKDNQKANRDFDDGGWFHSGDVGFVDERSNVYIVDRLKEFLRVGDGYGTHVSTGEIEAAIFDHPAVATAVVVGIRDQDTQQEHPTAFVVLQPEYKSQPLKPLTEEIERCVEKKLGTSKRLSGGAYFVDKYPQTGYDINKRLLKGLVNVGSTADRGNRYISVNA